MNSISESFKNNPENLNKIIPIDFNNVHELPDSHSWTTSSSSSFIDQQNTNIIPIIDLKHSHASTLIKNACQNLGVFQVINHGISVGLLSEIETQTRKLFSLPVDRKMLAIRSPDGISGYGSARMSTFFTKQMWHEGFTIMGSPLQLVSLLWPNKIDHSKFCEVIEESQKEMRALAERILGLMFTLLGLSHDDVRWFKPNHTESVLQLNSYPICPDPARAMGLAPHTDSSLLTLLYQNTGGLQVLVNNMDNNKNDVIWVPVNPCSNAVVVNVGDLMHIISNGSFKSALHRALVNDKCHRVSIANFCGPPRDVKLSPLMKLIESDQPPLYRAVTWKEYLDAKALYFNKALV